MPQFNARTIAAQQVWQSPDGQRTIYNVTLDIDGKQVSAKTYSAKIAQNGFSGEIESYERQGRNGPETYVKQVPKEGGFSGSGGTQSTGGRTSYAPKDEAAINAMWAIGQAVASLKLADAAVDPKDVEPQAVEFFNMVDRVKTGKVEDTVYNPDDVSMEDLGAAIDLGETPWPGN